MENKKSESRWTVNRKRKNAENEYLERAEADFFVQCPVSEGNEPHFGSQSGHPASEPTDNSQNDHVCQGNTMLTAEENIEDSQNMDTFDPETSEQHDSSHEESDASSGEDELSLSQQLSQWAVTYNISHSALGALLKILVLCANLSLPLHPRTLLQTPLQMRPELRCGGSYHYFGVAAAVVSMLRRTSIKTVDMVQLVVNCDGLPLFKSSNIGVWPILGMVVNLNTTVFTIGFWEGKGKPTSASCFLKDLVHECKALTQNGFSYLGKLVPFSLHAVLADAPARAFMKCIKGHTGYFGCERCTQEGEFVDGRMTFPDLAAQARTDSTFRNMCNEEHHKGMSPFVDVPSFDMVVKFPLDYMHLVCQGVVRTLLKLWMSGPVGCRLSSKTIDSISLRLVSLRSYLPRDFVRKPRSLNEFRLWKAVELRQFLLYSGPLALKGLIDDNEYDLFITLSTAMTILLSPKLAPQFWKYAKELLSLFTYNFGIMFGKQYIVYNIHSVIHIADDAARYGALDNISCFPFESYLNRVKRMVRKPSHACSQIYRRVVEIDSSEAQIRGKQKQKLAKRHFQGPLLDSMQLVDNLQQFKQFVDPVDSLFLTTCSGDNSIYLIDGRAVIIKNIVLQPDSSVIFLVRAFGAQEPLYTHPIDSMKLGICKVMNLTGDLMIVRRHDISAKCCLLPHGDGLVAIPLLHSSIA